MTEIASRSRAKKILRVSAALTGTTAGAVAFMPTAPAEAATANYQIQVSASGVHQLQICGDNQNNTWVCTPGENISHSSGNLHYWKNNWWWHGPVRLWWNGHGGNSVNNCNITTGDYYGWVHTSHQWITLYAGPNQLPTC
jgi:hypothetical protein